MTSRSLSLARRTTPVLALFGLVIFTAGAMAQDGPAQSAGDSLDESASANLRGDTPVPPKQQARLSLTNANRSIAQAEKLDAKAKDAKDPKKQADYREKAKKAFESAIGEYRNALRLDPTLVEAYVGLAELMIKSGRFDLAIQTAEQALQIDPKSLEALAAEGRAQLGGFKIAEAKATYDRIAAESAKSAKEFAAEMRSWLEAQRARLGPEMAEAVAELDGWIHEREK